MEEWGLLEEEGKLAWGLVQLGCAEVVEVEEESLWREVVVDGAGCELMRRTGKVPCR